LLFQTFGPFRPFRPFLRPNGSPFTASNTGSGTIAAPPCYNTSMSAKHPKSVRRRLLEMLYEVYMRNPLEMLDPEDVLADGTVAREDLISNAYYLSDRGLIELMPSYSPPMFAAIRITADGLDLVENEFEFNLRFPAAFGSLEASAANIPHIIEKLVEEADFSELDGENRRCLLRDVQYLRDELSRPAERWRGEVIRTVIRWIDAQFENASKELPSLSQLRLALKGKIDEPADTTVKTNPPVSFPKKS
jgi:hypothetical protein